MDNFIYIKLPNPAQCLDRKLIEIILSYIIYRFYNYYNPALPCIIKDYLGNKIYKAGFPKPIQDKIIINKDKYDILFC